MPKMGSGVRTSRGGKRAEQAKRLTEEVFAAAERYGLTEASEDLALLSAAAERAIAGGVSLDRLMQATEQGAERGESARRAARKAAPRKRSTGKREKAKPVEPAPVEARVEPVSEPEPAPAVAAKKLMVFSPFYPEQPCGLSYKDFRVGHTYKDAYHWLMTAQSEDSYRTITQRAVLRQLAKMKRATFEEYLSDCAAMEQYEQEQQYGGREGEYATEEFGGYDTSFDPSEFMPPPPADDFIEFNPRRKRAGRLARNGLIRTPEQLAAVAVGAIVESADGSCAWRKHGKTDWERMRPSSASENGWEPTRPPERGTRLFRVVLREMQVGGLRAIQQRPVPNPKIVSLGPHAYFAAAGLAMNARRTSRRPRKSTSRKS